MTSQDLLDAVFLVRMANTLAPGKLQLQFNKMHHQVLLDLGTLNLNLGLEHQVSGQIGLMPISRYRRFDWV